jgi:hypothetical protein
VSGPFAEWQPRYAEHGVATFPVRDKKPCIRGWQNVGLNGSSQLALKFPEAQAFGFQCGRSSGITLVDIDSSEDRFVGEAIRIFGVSPVIWRTGSGNYAMPFRFNGEKRRIRPLATVPIDVLGNGGYAVAPPSIGRNGRYEFIEGKLDDLQCLPNLTMPANENRSTPGEKIPVGSRSNVLFHYALDHARFVDDFDTLIDVVRTRNLDCEPPLSELEVIKTASSAWGYEIRGENLKGRGGVVVISNSVVDALIDDPDAWCLYGKLRRHHWARDFALSKTMAESMGWTLPRWKRARKKLIEMGGIECIRPGGRGPKDPPIYRLRGTISYPNKKLDTSFLLQGSSSSLAHFRSIGFVADPRNAKK